MVVSLRPEIEKAVREQAERSGRTPEDVVNEALGRELLCGPAAALPPPRDEWERRLANLGRNAGVSLTDEQLSSEGIYED